MGKEPIILQLLEHCPSSFRIIQMQTDRTLFVDKIAYHLISWFSEFSNQLLTNDDNIYLLPRGIKGDIPYNFNQINLLYRFNFENEQK